jgi:acetate kinase
MILIVNAGSSSLKVALYEEEPLQPVIRAQIDRLDAADTHWGITRAGSGDDAVAVPVASGSDQGAALEILMTWLDDAGFRQKIRAVGHRLVHGGKRFRSPVRIDAGVMRELSDLVPLAPSHLPQALTCIEAITRQEDSLVQVACFDTAFHRTMPDVARHLPLPREMTALDDVERFGFHGLSYEFITNELARQLPGMKEERIIIAHLGNGASMVAVHDGQAVDTTMGMTPAGGMMMSTRTGDLDPGVLVYLMRQQHLDANDVDTLVNSRSGLLGVSGVSGDMRDVQAAASGNAHAQEAIDLYCYLARKQLGGLVAANSGLDRLVFTGGVGQHNAAIRLGICTGLEFLGIRIDPERNRTHRPVISADDSTVTVMVMETNEELVIARHTLRELGTTAAGQHA